MGTSSRRARNGPTAQPSEESFRDFGSYEVHYNAVRTDALTPDTPVLVAEDGQPVGGLTLPDTPSHQHLVIPPDDEKP